MRAAAKLPGRLLLGALALVTVAAGCRGSAPGTGAAAGASAIPPTMTIERFLNAANQNDLDTMASLFGNREGSITNVWTREEIDGRMFIFASVLRHTDYTIAGEQIVPGRRDEATQFLVRMEISNQSYDVPFTLVRTRGSDHWLIENIAIETITRRPGTN